MKSNDTQTAEVMKNDIPTEGIGIDDIPPLPDERTRIRYLQESEEAKNERPAPLAEALEELKKEKAERQRKEAAEEVSLETKVDNRQEFSKNTGGVPPQPAVVRSIASGPGPAASGTEKKEDKGPRHEPNQKQPVATATDRSKTGSTGGPPPTRNGGGGNDDWNDGSKKGIPQWVMITIIAMLVLVGLYFAGKHFLGGQKDSVRTQQHDSSDQKRKDSLALVAQQVALKKQQQQQRLDSINRAQDSVRTMQQNRKTAQSHADNENWALAFVRDNGFLVWPILLTIFVAIFYFKKLPAKGDTTKDNVEKRTALTIIGILFLALITWFALNRHGTSLSDAQRALERQQGREEGREEAKGAPIHDTILSADPESARQIVSLQQQVKNLTDETISLKDQNQSLGTVHDKTQVIVHDTVSVSKSLTPADSLAIYKKVASRIKPEKTKSQTHPNTKPSAKKKSTAQKPARCITITDYNDRRSVRRLKN